MESSTSSQNMAMLSKLGSLAAYFDGALKRLIVDKQSGRLVECSSQERPEFIIVARSHFKEKCITLPFTDKKQVNAYLELELSQYKNARYEVASQSEEQSVILIWVFSEAVPNATLLVPESVLYEPYLGKSSAAKLTSLCGKAMYIAKQGSLIRSAFTSPLISSKKNFYLSLNLPFDEFMEDEAAICPTLEDIRLSLVTRFFYLAKVFTKFSITLTPKAFLQFLVPSVIATGLFFVVSSAYLFIQEARLTELVTSKSAEVSDVLDMQNRIDAIAKKRDMVTELQRDHRNAALVWPILDQFFGDELYSSISLERGRYVLRGDTMKATDLLAKIAATPGVLDAKFDAATRESRGREIFVISFLISEQDAKNLLVVENEK